MRIKAKSRREVNLKRLWSGGVHPTVIGLTIGFGLPATSPEHYVASSGLAQTNHQAYYVFAGRTFPDLRIVRSYSKFVNNYLHVSLMEAITLFWARS